MSAAHDAPPLEQLISDWLPLPDVADRMQLKVTAVRQLLRDGKLLAARVGDPAVLRVPADLLSAEGGLPDAVVKGLSGLITVLRDGRFDDGELLRWLFTEDPTLPGTPVAALRGDRGTEVKRRAQAIAL